MRHALLLLAAFFLLQLQAHAQLSRIVTGEYFFDTDPGFGNATPLPAFTGGESIDVSFLSASSGLAAGMHTLVVRVRDDNNVWSMPHYTMTYVLANDPLTLENITAAEYFFDTDPGAGNGTSITVSSAGPLVDVSFAAATSGLTMGMHIFAVRVRNINGQWGLPTYTPLYVDRDRIVSKIEYAFDTDPGPGSATAIDVTPPTDNLDQEFNLPTGGLPVGPHSLIVRVAGQQDFWSIADTVDFVICAAATADFSADIVCVGSPTSFTDNSTVLAGDVYQWDFDSDGSVDATTGGNQSFTYPSAGMHAATLTIDRGGCLATMVVQVTIDDAATTTAGTDQTICENGSAALTASVGGTGSSGTWSTGGDGSFDNSLLLNVAYTPGPLDILAGTATVTFTTDDPPGACSSATSTVNVTIGLSPTVNAGPDSEICSSSPINLSGSIGASATSALWTTAGDGLFDDPASLTPVYTPGVNDINGGTVDIHLTTNDPAGPCAEEDDEMRLTITPQATVDAGSDQSICGTASATLSGVVSGSPTFAWTTSGDGTFDDPGILNAIYSPGPNDVLAGNMSLTLTADPGGACPIETDDVVIAVTQMINIVSQTLDASIAVLAMANIEAGGTFNTNDVLSATIQAAPTKGVAMVNSSNTLEYTANNGTVGKDSVLVQVCNQCNQCDSEYIVFDIENEPPVVSIPVSQTQTGSQFVIDAAAFISDPNNNIDPSSIIILSPPTSGASASFTQELDLILDYTGINFSGTDNLTIQVCDNLAVCTQYVISVNVEELPTDIEIYNAVAPNSTNGDNKFMRIRNLPSGSKVTIYNRWGDKVFEVFNYDENAEGKRFAGKADTGKDLPSGIYFYKIEVPAAFGSDSSVITGYLALRQ